MDTRTVQRMLEKIQAMAETAEHVGMRSAEGMQREARLSEGSKKQLAPLYREHALRLMSLYSDLGARICETVRDEAEDETSRGLVDLFHANFSAMRDRARESLRREFGADSKLD
jgi:hypothetical protein